MQELGLHYFEFYILLMVQLLIHSYFFHGRQCLIIHILNCKHFCWLFPETLGQQSHVNETGKPDFSRPVRCVEFTPQSPIGFHQPDRQPVHAGKNSFSKYIFGKMTVN